jgi:hypothetical protein
MPGENNIGVLPELMAISGQNYWGRQRFWSVRFFLAQLEISLEMVDDLTRFAKRHDIPMMLRRAL